MKKQSLILAIDLGGTNTKLALVCRDLKIKKEISVPTLGHLPPERAVESWMEAIQDWLSLHSIFVIGMGSPGPLDTKRGIILHTPNLPGWSGFSLAHAFKKYVKAPCFVENDAKCAALGEWSRHKISDMIVLTLGTGVGCGIITGGELLRGPKGIGSEAGHMTIDQNGPLCNCGKRGCLEAFVGAYAFVSLYNSKASQKVSSPEEIFALADEGKSPAIEIRDLWVRALAVGVGNLINIFNPRLIVLTGGVSRSFDKISASFGEILLTQAFEDSVKWTKVVVSRLQQKSGLLGAALQAQKRL